MKKTSLNHKFYKDVEELILRGWTKKALARKGNNHPTDPLHPKAKRFCVAGAVMKIADEWDVGYGPYLVFLENLVRDLDDSGIGELTLHRYNDRYELIDMRKLLQKAAKKVRQKP